MTSNGKSMTYVGAGGNIGSHAVIAMARTGYLDRLLLIDPDTFEARNLASQDIARRDLGRLKVGVLAERIRRINPALRVDTIAEHVERVPPGRLRADIILTGLDNLASRGWINRVVRRLGVPWIDAGVRAEGLLARVDVFIPVSDTACMECAWGEAERATIDVRHPCTPAAASAPTGAPAYLGALAASLQCTESVKLLTGDRKHALCGKQIMVEATTHRHYVSTRARSKDCAFDHRRWSLWSLGLHPGAITAEQALTLVPSSPTKRPRLRVYGDAIVHRLVCPDCHASVMAMRLASQIENGSRTCKQCGATMAAAGIDITDTLDLDQLTDKNRHTSLHDIGLRDGDVFSIETHSGQTHFALGKQ